MFPTYAHSIVCAQVGLGGGYCNVYNATSTPITFSNSTTTSVFAFTDTNLLFMISVLTFFTIIQTILLYTNYNK